MAKSYKQMDRTSAAFAKDLDKRRQTNKKRRQAQAQAQRDKHSLSRGGNRC